MTNPGTPSSRKDPEKAVIIRMLPDLSRPARPKSAAVAARQREQQRLRILVVDKQRFMREVISTMLRRDDRFRVVAEAADIEGALAGCQQHHPDLVVMDIKVPGEGGGDAVRKLVAASPNTRVLLCAAFAANVRALGALESGAHGFVEKTNTWDEFVDAIERVARGEHYFSSSLSSSQADEELAAKAATVAPLPLTAREAEVAKMVAHGDSSKEISRALGVSIGTVNVHRSNLMKKLQVKNLAGIVIFALHAGLIE